MFSLQSCWECTKNNKKTQKTCCYRWRQQGRGGQRCKDGSLVVTRLFAVSTCGLVQLLSEQDATISASVQEQNKSLHPDNICSPCSLTLSRSASFNSVIRVVPLCCFFITRSSSSTMPTPHCRHNMLWPPVRSITLNLCRHSAGKNNVVLKSDHLPKAILNCYKRLVGP